MALHSDLSWARSYHVFSTCKDLREYLAKRNQEVRLPPTTLPVVPPSSLSANKICLTTDESGSRAIWPSLQRRSSFRWADNGLAPVSSLNSSAFEMVITPPGPRRCRPKMRRRKVVHGDNACELGLVGEGPRLQQPHIAGQAKHSTCTGSYALGP